MIWTQLWKPVKLLYGLPRWLSERESACQCRRHRRHGFSIWMEKMPWRGNGNPLQYSFLKNPTDGGTWQAAVQGVTKSRTQLSNWAYIDSYFYIIFLSTQRFKVVLTLTGKFIQLFQHHLLKEMQVKTTMRYHLTPVRMAAIKKSTNNKC